MAGILFHSLFIIYFSSISFAQIISNPTNIPLENINGVLFQSAINALNENSPTHHKYKTGNLISAQKVVEPPYKVYRLTFNLNPICEGTVESCPKEACTINLKQHELGTIIVQKDSIQCMYLYPQSTQDNGQDLQETMPDNLQESEWLNNLNKQIVNNNKSVELDHEVQTTGDQNDKPFIAVRASESSYCPGCPYELNPNLPGLIMFGEQVVRSMDEIIENDYKHKVVKIIKVTRTVPPSKNTIQYDLILEIGETNCLKNTPVERTECSVPLNAQTKTCLVTFEEQPWQQNSRIIKSNNCSQVPITGNEVNANIEPNHINLPISYSEKKQNVMGVEETSYSESPQNNKEEAYERFKDMLLENITYTTNRDADLHQQQQQTTIVEEPIVKILLNDSVDEKQISSEKFVDKEKEFDKFLEDFDLPIKTESTSPETNGVPVLEEIMLRKTVESEAVTSSTESTTKVDNSEDERVREFGRTKRSASLATYSASSNFINELAERAISTLDNIDDDNKKRMLVRVLDWSKEKSSDTLYRLKLKIINTECKEKGSNAKECWRASKDVGKICHMLVRTKEENSLENVRVLRSECHPAAKTVGRVKRRSGLVGAASRKNVNDSDIINFAQLGLNKFSQLSESTYEPIIVEITEASTQIVSGTLYRIKVKLGTSNCQKGNKVNCQVQEGSDLKNCLITVWSQPWIDLGSPEVNVTCDPEHQKTKRSLKGEHYSWNMLKQAKDLKQERMFKDFLQEYQRTYASKKEMNYRFKIFRKNLDIIDKLNKDEQGTAVYGVNMFADVSPEEFRNQYLGLRPELRQENEIPYPQARIPNVKLPNEFDWRHYNVVTPVKDQGQCGSCWAFSVTGNVEGQYAIKHKKLLSLSEQELLDCDKLDDGCEGGLPDSAYRAIEKLGGLEVETDYPYHARDEKCHFDKNQIKVRIISAVNITSNETQMAQWLVKNGPIAIGINANAMQFYMGGISHPLKFLCNRNNLDHGVLIVGYGVHTYPLFKRTLPYWTIKNSWGPRWGEQGYYRVYRGDGTCGLNTMASSAIVL